MSNTEDMPDGDFGTIIQSLEGVLPKVWADEFDTPKTIFEGKRRGRRNEFLFFIKPELLLPELQLTMPSVLQLVVAKLIAYDLTPSAVRLLPARYLAKSRLIEAHYGVINRLARSASTSLSATAREAFKQETGQPVESTTVLGGFEFLTRFPEFSPASLDALWGGEPSKKLAAGTYCRTVRVGSDLIYLINGFHPNQISHFTERGRSIVVFDLEGDVDWRAARQELLGATNPSRALAGSLRAELLEKRQELGLAEISQGVNGAHLSAGPVESLIELCRYLKDELQPSSGIAWENFLFGQRLREVLSVNDIRPILDDAVVTWEGRPLSVFELTEELNSREALERLTSVAAQFQQSADPPL